MNRLQRSLSLAPWARLIKFGVVGTSGTVINILSLMLAQEYLLVFIDNETWRLRASLTFAIGLATLNNFYWNHLWTWADRERLIRRNRFIQLLQYTAASWIGISIQLILTPLLTSQLNWHYSIANLCAIGIAALANFVINDRWTFWVNRRKNP